MTKHLLGRDHTERLAVHACHRLGLGHLRSWQVFTTGYEDTTLELSAARGRYVLKAFAGQRAPLAARTAAVITAARAAGVNHPQLHATPDGNTLHTVYDGTAYLLMDRTAGADLYTLARAPSPGELAALIAQVARLHTLDLDLGPVEDPWAIPHLASTAGTVAHLLTARERDHLQRVLGALEAAAPAALPRALIHGDLTQGNVLIPLSGDVVLIDFATAEYHPRIQELAVAAANLTAAAPAPLPERLATLADLYDHHHRLTDAEHRALPAYGAAAAAMEYLGALRARHLEGIDDDETLHVLQLGREGLHQAAAVM